MHVLCTRQAGCDRWAGAAAARARRAGPVCVWCSACCLCCSVQRLSWGIARHDCYSARPPPLSCPCVHPLVPTSIRQQDRGGMLAPCACQVIICDSACNGRQGTWEPLGPGVQAAGNRLNLAGNRWEPLGTRLLGTAGNWLGTGWGTAAVGTAGNWVGTAGTGGAARGNPGPNVWELFGNP